MKKINQLTFDTAISLLLNNTFHFLLRQYGFGTICLTTYMYARFLKHACRRLHVRLPNKGLQLFTGKPNGSVFIYMWKQQSKNLPPLTYEVVARCKTRNVPLSTHKFLHFISKGGFQIKSFNSDYMTLKLRNNLNIRYRICQIAERKNQSTEVLKCGSLDWKFLKYRICDFVKAEVS